MNLKRNDFDLNRTLEQLENDYWPEYQFETSLIEKCHKLRKVEINQLSIENLRMLIGQNIGLKYLIPVAIIKLEKDIMIEGDFYEGDLLLNVLKSDKNYWKNCKENHEEIVRLLKENSEYIDNFELLQSIKDDIHKAIIDFMN